MPANDPISVLLHTVRVEKNQLFKLLQLVHLGDKLLKFGYEIEWSKTISPELTSLTPDEQQQLFAILQKMMRDEFTQSREMTEATDENLEAPLLSRERIHRFLTVPQALAPASQSFLADLSEFDQAIQFAIPTLKTKSALQEKVLAHAKKLPASTTHWWLDWFKPE